MKVRNGTQEAGSFNPIPEGRYLCSIANVEEVNTKKGDKMWKLTLEVKGELINGVTTDMYAGRKLFDNLVWTEKGEQRIKRLLRRLRIADDTEVTTRHLLDKEVAVEVIQEDYKGEKQNKVTFAGYTFPDPAEEDAYQAAKKAGTPVSANLNNEKSDIPF